MNSENLLLIFIKNPVLGKVKTRLAKTIGDYKALLVYEKLVAHTNQCTQNVNAIKRVCYSDFISNDDDWKNDTFEKHLQKGEDLGDKMSNAFSEAFDTSYKRIIIIGSDCYDIDEDTINQAFKVLEEKDVVIGPAKDGGYYLLGMRMFIKELFENKKWSTDTVFKDTLENVSKLNVSFSVLKECSDIDNEEDVKHYPALVKLITEN